MEYDGTTAEKFVELVNMIDTSSWKELPEQFQKLLYISKSKMGLYNSCPFAFKLSYIDKVKVETPIYFTIGIEVHNFIEQFFKTISFDADGDLVLPQYNIEENKAYKKNVIKFEIDRWKVCIKSKTDEAKKYFMPLHNEESITVENPKLTGIVDRVHLSFKNEVVVVENKTGKPTPQKNKDYYIDLLWYKLLLEMKFGYKISKGSLYYPYNNYVCRVRLYDTDADGLLKKIDVIREKIRTAQFEPKPSRSNCNNCRFKLPCPHRVR